MQFRIYTPDDRAACMAILDSNLERYFSPHDVADFARFLDDPPGIYGVVVLQSRVVACGGIAFRDGTADFTWGMVHSDHHGQGIGRFLVGERMKFLRDRTDITCVQLNTSHETVGFYAKMGFSVTRHTPNGYRAGLDRYDMEMPWNELTALRWLD